LQLGVVVCSGLLLAGELTADKADLLLRLRQLQLEALALLP
jgi:hypothetical protein